MNQSYLFMLAWVVTAFNPASVGKEFRIDVPPHGIKQVAMACSFLHRPPLRGGYSLVNPAHMQEILSPRGKFDRRTEGRDRDMIPDHTLYISNIEDLVDEETLYQIFIGLDNFTRLNMPRDHETNEHMGYAFVEFLDEESAAQSYKLLNFQRINGRPVRIVHTVRPENSRYAKRAKIFVRNVAPEVTEWDIWWAFRTFGFVMDVRIPRDQLTQKAKGVAFVQFADWPSCEKALHLMDGQVLAGRDLQIRYSADADLPEHLIGTPWQVKAKYSQMLEQFRKKALPDWVLEAKKNLPEEERRLQEANDRRQTLARRGRLAAMHQEEKQKKMMKIAFGGGMGKRKIREIKDRKKTQREQEITRIKGLRGGGFASWDEIIKDQDFMNGLNISNYSDTIDAIAKESERLSIGPKEVLNKKLLNELDDVMSMLSTYKLGSGQGVATEDDIEMVSEKVSLSTPLETNPYECDMEGSSDLSGASGSDLDELISRADPGESLYSITQINEGHLGVQQAAPDSLDEEIEELEGQEQSLRQSLGLSPDDNITQLYLQSLEEFERDLPELLKKKQKLDQFAREYGPSEPQFDRNLGLEESYQLLQSEKVSNAWEELELMEHVLLQQSRESELMAKNLSMVLQQVREQKKEQAELKGIMDQFLRQAEKNGLHPRSAQILERLFMDISPHLNLSREEQVKADRFWQSLRERNQMSFDHNERMRGGSCTARMTVRTLRGLIKPPPAQPSQRLRRKPSVRMRLCLRMNGGAEEEGTGAQDMGGGAKRVTRSSVVSDHLHEVKSLKKPRTVSSSDSSKEVDDEPQYAKISSKLQSFLKRVNQSSADFQSRPGEKDDFVCTMIQEWGRQFYPELVDEVLDDYKVFEKEFDCPTLQSSRSNIYPNGSVWDACEKGDANSIIRALQEGTVRIDEGCPHDLAGLTLFHLAAWWGNCRLMEALLEQGANVNLRDEARFTPLHYAAMTGQGEAVKFLCSRGAEVDAVTEAQCSPLHYAASEGQTEVVSLLVEHGADLFKTTKSGLTPLTHATANFKEETAELVRRLMASSVPSQDLVQNFASSAMF